MVVIVRAYGSTGCGSSDDTTEETEEIVETEEVVCSVSENSGVENTYLPQITFTEVDETASAHDSKATAQVIAASNTIITGEGFYPTLGSCNGCDDFYSLAVEEGDELALELKTADGMTAFLYLYNGDEANSVAYTESADDTQRLEYTVPTGMTQMYMYVYTYATNAQTTGQYTLQIKSPVEPVAIAATLPAECLANLQGALSNAVNGTLVASATVNLREGTDVKTGDVDYTVDSDAQGNYELTDVEAGDYTIEIVKDGFIDHYLDITLEGEENVEKKFQLSPALEEGQFRIILSWGAKPSVLDSQLHGPRSNGSTSFLINWKNYNGDGANLDRDATNGYGPETITISTFNTGTYTYWVNDYSNEYNNGSTQLGDSGANVTVYDHTGIIKQYKIPAGTGNRWSVFTMDVVDGEPTITDVNTLGTFSYSP